MTFECHGIFVAWSWRTKNSCHLNGTRSKMVKLIDAHHRQTLENISDGRLKMQDAVARRTFFFIKTPSLTKCRRRYVFDCDDSRRWLCNKTFYDLGTFHFEKKKSFKKFVTIFEKQFWYHKNSNKLPRLARNPLAQWLMKICA